MSKYDRQQSPFIAFCYAKRDEIKATNPSSDVGDIGKILSNVWKDMSDSEKAVYSCSLNGCNNNKDKNNQQELGLRRSSRLRNKLRKVNFFGVPY